MPCLGRSKSISNLTFHNRRKHCQILPHKFFRRGRIQRLCSNHFLFTLVLFLRNRVRYCSSRRTFLPWSSYRGSSWIVCWTLPFRNWNSKQSKNDRRYKHLCNDWRSCSSDWIHTTLVLFSSSVHGNNPKCELIHPNAYWNPLLKRSWKFTDSISLCICFELEACSNDLS